MFVERVDFRADRIAGVSVPNLRAGRAKDYHGKVTSRGIHTSVRRNSMGNWDEGDDLLADPGLALPKSLIVGKVGVFAHKIKIQGDPVYTGSIRC